MRKTPELKTVYVSVVSELDLILGFYFEERDTTCRTIVIDITLVRSIGVFLRVKEFVESASGKGG
jgi:hypothetical protein